MSVGLSPEATDGTASAVDARFVVLVSNALDPPPDEGIKKCAQQLAALMRASSGHVAAIAPDAGIAGKLLLSPSLLNPLRRRGPRLAIYVPSQSATFGSFVRVAVLRTLGRVDVVMLSMQPVPLTRASAALARVLGPALVFTPDPSYAEQLAKAGVPARFIPMGVDTSKFRPLDPAARPALRAQLGLPSDRRIVLHVGHARELRRLDWVTALASDPDVLPVIVIGRSLGADPAELARLRCSDAHVIEHFMPDVERLYQAADVYAFPVEHEGSAVGIPLSVLEAMACNVPVVSTPFGGLPSVVREEGGFAFARDEAQFRARIREALERPAETIDTRRQMLGYTWSAVGEKLLAEARRACASA